MAKTAYNYKRYKMSEYEFGVFPGAKAGEIAKNFTVHDQDGNEVLLEQYSGEWVVLETGSITCSTYVKNIGSIKKFQA
jgi:cytochrome oxidase Cu insertion factor (SCO1/SenC/PrrC family)|tara:strand:+ start:151 stop:384 length:234 start_codon:yes stop_codon:yes gene_type:complete